MEDKKALVVFSGGMDSTVGVYWATKNYKEVETLSFNYGSKHNNIEHSYALKTCEKLGLKRGEVVLSGHTHVAGIFPQESGVVNINPGSTTLPKGGTPAGFALVDENAIGLYTLEGERYTQFVWTEG